MDGDLDELREYYESSALDFLDPKNTFEYINFWEETHEHDPDKLLDIREQNAKGIKDMLLWSNASPSNLRYGDASSNSGIQENYDPMGDTMGTITAKESQMIEKYVISYTTEEFEGKYYLRSSTGVYQPDSKNMNRWYIKCLQNNEECF